MLRAERNLIKKQSKHRNFPEKAYTNSKCVDFTWNFQLSDCFSIEVNLKFILTEPPGCVWFNQSSDKITVIWKINSRQRLHWESRSKTFLLRVCGAAIAVWCWQQAFMVEICRKVTKRCKLFVQFELQETSSIQGAYRNCRLEITVDRIV